MGTGHPAGKGKDLAMAICANIIGVLKGATLRQKVEFDMLQLPTLPLDISVQA